jgi:hypothetical protein
VAGSGPGAWATFSGTGFSVLILVAGAGNGKTASPSTKDWILFAGTLTAVPAWIATKDAFWAGAVCSSLTRGAYWFAFANAVRDPPVERIDMYRACCARGALSLLGNGVQSASTVLYPATSLLLNVATCGLIVVARRGAKDRRARSTR